MKKVKNRTSVTIRMIFQLLTAFLFVCFTVVMGVAFIFSPKISYSEVEKRELTKFPKLTFSELTSGNFTENLTKYVSDNFAFRENLVKLSSDLEDKRGIRVDGVKIYSSKNNNNSNIYENKTSLVDPPLVSVKKPKKLISRPLPGEEISFKIEIDSIVQNADLYANLDDAEIMGEQRGALFMVKNTALEIFYGNIPIAMDYCSILNTYKQAVGNDVTVYNLIIPTHFEFGLPKKYKNEVGSAQKPVIDEIYNNLDASIITVDAYSNIEKYYKKGEYLYFNSDHHWTSLGAYRAYCAFAQQADLKITPLKNFEKRTINEFLGTFYSSTNDKNLASNPDRVDYYIPPCNYQSLDYKKNGVDTYEGALIYENLGGISTGYLVFMGGDVPLSIITTDNNSGRSILVFKESYGNAFVPFLVSNYDKVYVADIRTFPFNAVDYVKEKNIGEVLFINNTMTSCTPARIKNYIDLMEK